MAAWAKQIIIVAGAAQLLALLLFFVLLSLNFSSRTIALAIGALLGASVILGIQLLFELRPTTESRQIVSIYTIDAKVGRIRQWRYPMSLSDRYIAEKAASDNLAKYHPDFAKNYQGGNDLTHQFTLFSLVSYLILEQQDWQTQKSVYKTGRGTITTSAPLSKPNECSAISRQQFAEMLTNSGNAFTPLPFMGWEKICLPPKSSLSISKDKLEISNPYFDLKFEIGPMVSMTTVHPEGGDDPEPLPNGTPHLTTWTRGITATVNYSALLSQSRTIERYKAWVKQVVDGAQAWFELRPDGQGISYDADKDDYGIKYVSTGGGTP